MVRIRRPGKKMLTMAIDYIVLRGHCHSLSNPSSAKRHCTSAYPKDKAVCHKCWEEYLKWEEVDIHGRQKDHRKGR